MPSLRLPHTLRHDHRRRSRSLDERPAGVARSRIHDPAALRYPATFQVADDAGVSVIAPPNPIVNADNPERVSRRSLRRLTTRRSVSLLTGSISRFAKLAAGRPPSASPRWGQYSLASSCVAPLLPGRLRRSAP